MIEIQKQTGKMMKQVVQALQMGDSRNPKDFLFSYNFLCDQGLKHADKLRYLSIGIWFYTISMFFPDQGKPIELTQSCMIQLK